mgnify:CR=1 FL=1
MNSDDAYVPVGAAVDLPVGSLDGAEAASFDVTTVVLPGEKGEEVLEVLDPEPLLCGEDCFVFFVSSFCFFSKTTSSTAKRRNLLNAIARKYGWFFHDSPETHRKRRKRSAFSTSSYGPQDPGLCIRTHWSCAPSNSWNRRRTSSHDSPSVCALRRMKSRSDLKGTFRRAESPLALRNRSVSREHATERFSDGVSASSPWEIRNEGETRVSLLVVLKGRVSKVARRGIVLSFGNTHREVLAEQARGELLDGEHVHERRGGYGRPRCDRSEQSRGFLLGNSETRGL